MSIAAIGSSQLLTTTSTAATTSAASNPTAVSSIAIGTDTVSLSAAAQQSGGSSTTLLSQLENQLRQIRSKINGYEHQVSWQLDHKTAVTGPAGTAGSNTSTPSLSAAPGVGELIHTQSTSAISSQVSLNISGPQGNVSVSFAAGTQLSAIAAAVNNEKSTTGVSAALSGNSLKFDSAGTGANQFVTVTAVNGSFDTTSNTSTGATAQTIAAGFASLQSGLDLTDANQLTDAQAQQLNTDYQKLGTEQTRFQNYIARQTTPDYASRTHQLSGKINAFEHQVTYQIDQGLPVSPPAGTTSTANGSNGTTTTATSTSTAAATASAVSASTSSANKSTGTTANTSTGATLPQTITAGFAALQAQTQQSLGSLPASVAAELKQLEQSLTTEQTRFTAFATKRFAYRAAQPTGQTQDVAG